jgi:hypothetical protein
MPPFKKTPEFLGTDRGKLAQYRKRKRSRIVLTVDNLEPQSKKMPEAERDRFQASVLQQLDNRKRGPFRGDIALKIDLSTTSKNAPQAHTIAKNLLDLLAKRRPSVPGRSGYVLYKDDSQIEALSVSCRHGRDQSGIRIEGRSFASMLADIELAAHATMQLETDAPASFDDRDEQQEWLKTLRDLLRDEAATRTRLGDSLYEAYVKMSRWSAQRALLSAGGVNLPVLSWLYGLPKGRIKAFSDDFWPGIVNESKLRFQIGELPTVEGSSDAFRQRIADEIVKFKTRWDWVINPLVLAVALEVVVRPSPSTPKGVLHDLDNIVRDYLLPRIVPAFDTVTDQIWTIDLEELRRTEPDFVRRWGSTPPKGTRSGVTRYEAWRLPPASDGAPGFVSVALIADIDVRRGLAEQLDKVIDKWSDNMEPEPNSLWSRRRR